jgi:hypothetical protein
MEKGRLIIVDGIVVVGVTGNFLSRSRFFSNLDFEWRFLELMGRFFLDFFLINFLIASEC